MSFSEESRKIDNIWPWICHGVIDVGRSMDVVAKDVSDAKGRSRQEALRLFEGVKAAHADWLRSYKLSRKALRRAGSPFSDAYDDLEHWLAETATCKKKQPAKGLVYVIGMVEDAKAVKIGFANDVHGRRSTLQTSSPYALEVLVAMKGAKADERELHRRFATDRIRGEWFRRSAAVEEFISVNRNKILPNPTNYHTPCRRFPKGMTRSAV